MSNQFSLDAQVRGTELQGKGASRRLRKQNLVPAIIYGASEEPLAISIAINKLVKALDNEAFFSHVLTINVEGADEPEEVVIKDLQRHPAKGFPMHADFLRIVKGQKMTMRVPLHFVGEDSAPGSKAGGVINTMVTDVEVSCIPSKIPEYLEIDISTLEIGDALHLSDINLPEDVTINELESDDGTDRTVVTIQAPRKEEPQDDADADNAADDADAAGDADGEGDAE